MKRLCISALLAMFLMSSISIASASSSRVKPGTAAQVKAIVAASTSIKRVPKDLTPSIQSAPFDGFLTAYPQMQNGCLTLSECVFGDTTASKSIILFGDSHAAMWLPAITPFALKDHYKIIVFLDHGCPAADIEIDNPITLQYNVACTAQRVTDINLINGYLPNYIIIADKTSGIVSNATGTYATNNQWQAAMQETLTLLEPSKAKIAIVSDINVFAAAPEECLAAYPGKVQECSVANPDTSPAQQGHQPAEQAAAKAMGADYINTSPWLCTSTKCCPIIGHFMAYADANHITVDYSVYLSTVVGQKLEAFTK
jgi:SGNH domain (fused to AT3 domains)